MSWQTVVLGDACELYQPKTISTKEMVDDGAYVVFGANGIIGRYDKYNHEDPQLLITCRGATCGAVNVSTPKAWINGNAMVVRPKSDNINFRFLEYLFRGGIDLSKTITGAAQPQITRQTLAPLKISYPKSLPEQQRIVGVLDAAFAALREAEGHVERNRANARELFESYLNGVFEGKGDGWKDTRLDEVCDFQNGFAFKSSTFRDQGVPVLRISNIQDGQVDNSRPVFVDPSDYREDLSRYLIVEGDLVIAMSGATTGKIGFSTQSTTFYLNQRVGKFEPRKELNRRFLYYFLSTKIEENLSISAGSAQPNLSTEQIKNFDLPLPPIREQELIVSDLDSLYEQTRKLETTYQQKLIELDGLKKGLLGAAFRGEL